jgi:hypothetical protein
MQGISDYNPEDPIPEASPLLEKLMEVEGEDSPLSDAQDKAEVPDPVQDKAEVPDPVQDKAEVPDPVQDKAEVPDTVEVVELADSVKQSLQRKGVSPLPNASLRRPDKAELPGQVEVQLQGPIMVSRTQGIVTSGGMTEEQIQMALAIVDKRKRTEQAEPKMARKRSKTGGREEARWKSNHFEEVSRQIVGSCVQYTVKCLLCNELIVATRLIGYVARHLVESHRDIARSYNVHHPLSPNFSGNRDVIAYVFFPFFFLSYFLLFFLDNSRKR